MRSELVPCMWLLAAVICFETFLHAEACCMTIPTNASHSAAKAEFAWSTNVPKHAECRASNFVLQSATFELQGRDCAAAAGLLCSRDAFVDVDKHKQRVTQAAA
ncbi:hypothetical protein C7974DRAFT_382005 [Boeremia exigua]|uniref:uncharacterized protein n=1 Tax=Boeremia exigua TaxID=749465 RepID=UPI001E8E9E77|nr:uncharacterized protein C7974DRAFT_382005 [Boeremia exigua]KAH6643675.1 hypothetical protein C7974DRAFT_382005 [Boeremia exigua]